MITPAHAQQISQDSASNDGDIVVTAQRRDESLQQVPISISAFTQKSLDRQGVRTIQDVVRTTPGLNFTRGGQQQLTNISIRGIRSNGGASTTGIYLDDVAIQARRVGFAGGSPFLQAFDLARVEVLRGPQGTLFGAGAQGGAIRFITPTPSLTDLSAYGRAEISQTRYGGTNYEGGAAVGGPLIKDVLGFRVSGWYRRNAGWVDRADPRTGAIVDHDINDGDVMSLKAALLFEPSDSVSISPSIFYQREHSDNPGFYWDSLSRPSSGRFLNGNGLEAPSTDKFYIPSLTVRVAIADTADLTLVTSYLHRNQDLVADYTALVGATLLRNPVRPATAAAPNDFANTQRSFSQEVRLQSSDSHQRFRWVIGGFYQRSKQNATQVNADPTIPAEFLQVRGIPFTTAFGQPLLNGNLIYLQDPYKTVDEQLAGFAQVDWDIVDKLTVTAGIRVARTKFNFVTSVAGPFGGVPFTDRGRQSETPVTPKVGVSYRVAQDSNLYASATKGYRVGGSNPRQLSICQPQLASLGLGSFNPTTYDSDSVWSYEIGSKNQFLDRHLTINASAFYIDWSNIQQFVRLSSCGGGFLANLGKAVSKGFDLEISARPTEGLTFTATAGYTHGELKQTVYPAAPAPGRAAVSAGDRIQGSPWRVTLSGEYLHPLSDTTELYGRLDYQFSSKEPRNVAQLNAANGLSYDPFYIGPQESHFMAARVGAVFGQIDASIFVDNLLNSTAILDSQNLARSYLNYQSTYQPRTIGLTVTMRH